MYNLLVAVILLVAIMMIAVVLIQESKGGGLSSNFSSANQLFGVRSAHNGVEKITWFLAGIMVVISVACAYVAPTNSSASSVLESAPIEATGTPAMPGAAPAAGAAEQKAAPAAATDAPAAAETPAAPAAPAK